MENIALASFGTRAAADSFLGWYRTWPVHDGKRNELSEEGRWGKVRWLSASTSEDHWIQLLFPGPQSFERVEIYWAQENGGFLKPRSWSLEVFTGRYWVALEAAEVVEEAHRSVLTFAEPVAAEQVRVFMPAGGGPAARPTVLGIAELEVYSASPRAGAPSTRVVLAPSFASRANPPWFNWAPVPGAVGYRVALLRDGVTLTYEVAGNEFMPDAPLEPGTWVWKVAPLLPGGPGAWSEPAFAEVSGEFTFPVAFGEAWLSGHPRLPAAAFDAARLRAEASGPKKALWEKIAQRLSASQAGSPVPMENMRRAEGPLAGLPAEPPGFEHQYWTIERWREIVAAGAAVLDWCSLSSFAYALTGEAAYRELARSWLLHAAGWDPVGSTGIESVDHAAHDTLVGIAYAYDALYADLSAEERATVRNAIAARCRALYRYLNPFENDPNNNHPWFQTTALGIGALAIWEEEPEARVWAEFAVRIYVGRYLCLGGIDGEWHEGSDYWT
ncbi:MAG: alginate lyase, partial [Symbiobacteriaceae bacterium]|nr:alginate lyase [Symbiobacteriaceae bacterium]